jgi:hypothetical protein
VNGQDCILLPAKRGFPVLGHLTHSHKNSRIDDPIQSRSSQNVAVVLFTSHMVLYPPEPSQQTFTMTTDFLLQLASFQSALHETCVEDLTFSTKKNTP